MSIASDCGACMTGNHEQHDRNHGIRPGVIGGTYCDCSGDCDERARAQGEEFRALLTPPADRAESIGDAEQEPSPSTLWPHGPIVGHPKHDYYVCGSCHQPLGPGPCPAKVPTQPDPPTFDSLLSDPTQQLDSEGVVIASIPAPDPTAGERECRYPCDCGQFPEEHCACMDGHASPPADTASESPATALMNRGLTEMNERIQSDTASTGADVEAVLLAALAEVAKHWGVRSRHAEWSDAEAQKACARDMRGQMTTALAAHDAATADRVRREAEAKALTDLADDIDSTGYVWTSVVDAERFKSRLRERAVRIAREQAR